MEQEHAEAIVSDPTGHSEETIAQAQAQILDGAPVSVLPKLSLTQTLQIMLEKSSRGEAGVYEELLVIIGEAKVKIHNVALKVKNDTDHIAHDISIFFKDI